MRAVIVAVALISCAAAPANGAQWYGAGLNSCGQWLEGRKSNDWYTMGQWMLGFVSAVSVLSLIELRESDSQAFAAFADKYCAEHPLDQFTEAVYALLQELRVPEA